MTLHADRTTDRWETAEPWPSRRLPPPQRPRRRRGSRLAAVLALLGLGAAAAAAAWYATLGPRRPPAELPVPRVLGLREPAAVRRLTHAGLRVRVHEPAGASARGVVVAQVPFAQTTVTRGSTVTLRVSAR